MHFNKVIRSYFEDLEDVEEIWCDCLGEGHVSSECNCCTFRACFVVIKGVGKACNRSPDYIEVDVDQQQCHLHSSKRRNITVDLTHPNSIDMLEAFVETRHHQVI